MKLIQLGYFVGIVKAGSLVTAARDMNIAQPVLSRHMNELEAELGVILLVRGRAGTRPTEAGELFYQRAVYILRHVEETVDLLRGRADGVIGRVNVGIIFYAADLLGPLLLDALQHDFPGITVSITDGLAATLWDGVGSGKLDLAVVPHSTTLARVTLEPVLREALYLVASRVGPAPQLGAIGLAETCGRQLVLPGIHAEFRQHLEHVAAAAGHRLDVRHEHQSMAAVHHLVLQGRANTIRSWPGLKALWNSGAVDVLRITDPEPLRQISLATRSHKPLTKAVHATRDLLRNLLRAQALAGEWPGALTDNPEQG
ncbi:LysR family transcriptional regulator [Palleronia sediminis]|uniref:LysR family transcriptional regulator n=1 Tax=Palleronia sediminis TaxID=2547833 RepID=A0A4R5ZZP9_9RHOB|nr:LysR family transcriptional regulator [Palleronia sediminis]TDL74146.1 LysR family transcriptional regulator [Palleronia sediminis]